MKKGDEIYYNFGKFGSPGYRYNSVGRILDVNGIYVKVLSKNNKILFLEKKYLDYILTRVNKTSMYLIESEYYKNYLKIHTNL